MVAPRIHSSDSMVNSKRERTERSIRLVTPAVSKESAPEVIVEYLSPWRFRKKILVCLDSSAEK